MGLVFIGYPREVPKAKLALIEQAIVAMKLKPKVIQFIDKLAIIETKKILLGNPTLADSNHLKIKSTISQIYLEHLEGNSGLYYRIYGVLDKYLSEEDLQFVVHFNSSDGGKRYSQVLSRMLVESGEAENNWATELKPLILQKLRSQFPKANLKLSE